MKFLEFDNTLSTFKVIKQDLLKVKKIISYLSMLLFSAYYIYLIVLNVDHLIYLSIYSLLFLTIFGLFLLETFPKNKNVLSKKDTKLAIEKKRKYRDFIKVFQYSAKAVLLAIALFEMVQNFEWVFSNILNIFLGVFLVLQVVFDVVVHYIIKQIDYIRLSFELDMGNSWGVQGAKKVKSFFTKKDGNEMEESYLKSQGESVHTPLEEIMLKDIKMRTEKYKQEKEEISSAKKEHYKKILKDKKRKKAFLDEEDD